MRLDDSARHFSWSSKLEVQTASKSARPMKPARGENLGPPSGLAADRVGTVVVGTTDSQEGSQAPSALALESGCVAVLPLVNAVLDRLGLEGVEAAALNDDRVGRARDRLFDADRAALMAETPPPSP